MLRRTGVSSWSGMTAMSLERYTRVLMDTSAAFPRHFLKIYSSRGLYRRLWGHGLWTWALSLGFKTLLSESGCACEYMVCQNMLAQVFRRFGMICARTGIAFP